MPVCSSVDDEDDRVKAEPWPLYETHGSTYAQQKCNVCARDTHTVAHMFRRLHTQATFGKKCNYRENLCTHVANWTNITFH